MKTVVYTREAIRNLSKIPAKKAETIREKVAQYAADPASLGNNVKALQGVKAFRLRVGDYRVIFSEEGVVLTVLRVGPRGSVYE